MKRTNKKIVAVLLTAALFLASMPEFLAKEASAAESAWKVLGEDGSEQTEQPAVTAAPTAKPVVTPSSPPFSGNLSNPRVSSDGVTTWDCVYFGNYWQEDTNGDGKADQNDAKQPIKWRVLSVDGDDVFLLADKNLDCQKYNDTHTAVTWETCTMRSWLNGYGAGSNKSGKDYSDDNFFDNAFSASEQSVIRTTNVINDDNPEYGTEGGSNTSDKVYLLSIDEVTNPAYGFSSAYSNGESRRAKNTEYTKVQGAYTEITEEYAGNGEWWLRSPGDHSGEISMVSHVGIMYRCAEEVDSNDLAVRPALHLSLSSTLGCSYAGTVSSDGTVTEPEISRLENPQTDSNGNTTWSCVYFGNYWQNDTNGDGVADKKDKKEPIKWRVLSVDGDDAFLLADQNLDCQQYNDTYTDVTWETCTMRSWLNGYGAGSNTSGKDYSDDNFLDNAFSGSEQSAIRTTNVVIDDNPEYMEGESNTPDKVYLLSIDEAMKPEYGFPSNYSNNDTRKAKNTKYVTDGGEIKSGFMFSIENPDYWWLRSPGVINEFAASVDYDGRVCKYGDKGNYDRIAVRPALHLNLSSDLSWSYAGRVTSDSKEVGTVPATSQPEVTGKPDDISLKNPSINSDGVTTWDCVYFGNYWQEDTNGDDKVHKNDAKQPIKWRVLSVDGDDAFLLADKNLDVQQYNKNWEDVTWETCTMRSWLNGYGAETNEPGDDFSTNNFLDNAFSGSDQSAIRTTNVVNNDNPEHGTEGGNDTLDKVYLLSIDEVTNPAYGFPSDYSGDDAWKAKQTKYTADGGEMKSGYMGSAGSTGSVGCWWLRSPGEHSDCAAGVDTIGIYRIGQFGYVVNSVFVAVRPALHLNLKASLDTGSVWLYAGTVTSEGEVEEPGSMPTETPFASAVPTENPETVPTSVPVATTKPTAFPTEEPSPMATVTPTRMPPAQTFIPLPTVAPTVTPSAAPSNPPFQKSLANPGVDSDGVTTWDCVYFGHYRQRDTNKDGIIDERDKEEPIKWRVLSVNGDDAFILSDKSLDAQEYDISGDDNITWETSTLRSWLNSTFYKKAFSAEEQNVINDVLVENKNNPQYGTSGGNNTRDNVFLLSLEELTNVAFGFSPDFQNPSNTRIAKDTDYTKTRVMYVGDEDSGGFWWLRTPGCSSEHAIDVSYDGSADLSGGPVWKAPNAVRPALHLNLKALPDTISDLCWSYAGTVSSDGTENEVAQPLPAPAVTSAPVVSPGIIPAATPAVNPTEEPEVTPVASLKPTEKPTGQPQSTTDPGPIQPPSQVAGPSVQIPTASAAVTKRQQDEDDDVDEDDEDDFEDEDEELKKGSYFMSGNFGYKITKLKKKKGEIAVVCVKSKKSKAYVIPNRVKKQGITFTVTSIQANAFKGCKKAKSLNIKAVAIKAIGKKALNGLNKKIRIKVPKKKFWLYRKMLRKCGYWTVRS